MLEPAIVDLPHHVALELLRHGIHPVDGQREPLPAGGLHRGRQSEEVALQQVRSQFEGHDGLVLGLHAFGHHEGADGPAEADEALDGLLFVVVALNAGDETAVDLQDVGFDQGNPVQVRVPRPHVVEHEQEAGLAKRGHELAELGHVVDLAFEDLEGHLPRRHARGVHHVAQQPRRGVVLAHHREGQVQEEHEVGGPFGQPREAAHRAFVAGALEVHAEARLGRHLEEHLRGDKLSGLDGAAGQGFQSDNRLPARGQDRLEVRNRAPGRDDVADRGGGQASRNHRSSGVYRRPTGRDQQRTATPCAGRAHGCTSGQEIRRFRAGVC